MEQENTGEYYKCDIKLPLATGVLFCNIGQKSIHKAYYTNETIRITRNTQLTN